MRKCTRCESTNYVKAGFKKVVKGKIQQYRCKECGRGSVRNRLSYLVRKSKAHAKSFDWLDKRLALFFVHKNLGA